MTLIGNSYTRKRENLQATKAGREPVVSRPPLRHQKLGTLRNFGIISGTWASVKQELLWTAVGIL